MSKTDEAAGGAGDVQEAQGGKVALRPIPIEGDAEETPGIPDGSQPKNTDFIKEMWRLRAGYPLKLSMEECLAIDVRTWPGRLYLEDTTYTELRFGGFDVVDDPRTPEARKEVYRAIAEWRKAGKTHREWKESGACPLCPKCDYLVWKGTKTGFYFRSNSHCLVCPCWDRWAFFRAVEKRLPPILRGLSLGSIMPSQLSNLSMKRQEQEIEFMRQHRLEGFLFLGPPGTSKSTFGAALFAHAIARDIVENRRRRYDGVEHIWRIEGNRLLEQEQAWACAYDKSEVRRDVTPEDVVRAVRLGYTPVLFLEEMDKRKLTQFGADIYFRLIDAVDQGCGQLIVTTNLDMKGLRRMLTQEEVRTTGEAILRRLAKLNVRDYHGKER